jgi:hypothetical protein
MVLLEFDAKLKSREYEEDRQSPVCLCSVGESLEIDLENILTRKKKEEEHLPEGQLPEVRRLEKRKVEQRQHPEKKSE